MAEQESKQSVSRRESFSFRRTVLTQQKQELQRRVESNPAFTAFEKRVGRYLEEIEPQVQSAVVSMYAKGYTTFSSGFYDFDPRYQTLEGCFLLEESTRVTLESAGVVVLEGYVANAQAPAITILQFAPETSDIDEIRRKWTDIVNLIPPKLRD